MVVLRRVAAALLVLLLLSGCSGAGTKTTSAHVASSFAPTASASGEFGSIAGSVVDDEGRAIAEADVGLLTTPGVARTDVAGKFTFNDLAPGPYSVAVGRLGYKPFAQTVNIAAGEVTEVKAVLATIEILKQPVVRTVPFTGFIQCSVNPLYFVNPCGDALGKNIDHTKIEFDATLELGELLLEMTWTPSFPGTSSELELDLCEPATDATAAQTGCFDHAGGDFYEYNSDKSPVRMNFTADKLPVGGKVLEAWVGGGLSSTATFQQPFTLYVTTCYVTKCPKGTTGLPPA